MAQLIARLPANVLRVAGYRALGCRIGADVRIGLKTLITSRQCVLEDRVVLGRNCLIACGRFQAGHDARILDRNTFVGQGRVMVGPQVRIIENHFFDAWHDVTIGEGSWIAGRGSQFWTHGTTKSKADQSIVIGSGVYVGSAALFAPGAGVGDRSLVAMGSVVAERFDLCDCVIAGNPAKVIRTGFQWSRAWG